MWSHSSPFYTNFHLPLRSSDQLYLFVLSRQDLNGSIENLCIHGFLFVVRSTTISGNLSSSSPVFSLGVISTDSASEKHMPREALYERQIQYNSSRVFPIKDQTNLSEEDVDISLP